MTARATTSSSNLFRRVLCPGSHHAEDGLPEETSEVAEEGHDLHALCANPALDRSHLEDEQLRVLERAHFIEEQVFANVIEDQQLEGEPFEEGYERELWLHRGLKAILPGHCDRWRYYPGKKVLVITDKKFGRLAVDYAGDNYQLRAYAVQGAQEWDCEAVYVAIIQPRRADSVSLVLYDRHDLEAARAEVLAIWDAAQKHDAPRRASEDACQYCKAKTDCPEYRAVIASATPLSQVPAKNLTPEQLTTCLTAIALLSGKWVKAIKDEARQRIRDGKLPNYILTENPPRRSIKDSARAFQLLREAGFADADMFHFATLSVGNAVKLYKTKGRTEREANDGLKLVLGPLLETQEIEPSIEHV